MHLYAIAALLLPVVATSSPAYHNVLSALAPQTSTIGAPSPGSTPTSVRLAPTAGSSYDGNVLELRQDLGLAPAAASPLDIPAQAAPPPVPAVPPPAVDPLVARVPVPAAPALPPAAVPPVDPGVPPAPLTAASLSPVTATTTIPDPPLLTGDDFVTVQWVETHIEGVRTWVPKTITFHFVAMSPAPSPGVGTIGMGTLTGKTGQTQTVYMVGAAPTPAVGSSNAIAAVVAVGLALLAV